LRVFIKRIGSVGVAKLGELLASRRATKRNRGHRGALIRQ
jgi:hypothetical protein